ncbi:MAG: hypothetical protein ACPLRX_02530 [Candidatus Saccharicenans sp.]
MKKSAIFLFVMSALTCMSFIIIPAPVRGQNVSLGLSITDGKVRDFYLSISNYFNVPAPTIVEFRERYRLADDELPVVFFLARRAGVEPRVIIDLRLKGLSWWDITLHFGLNPEIFFVPVTVVKVGPPYGRALGFYRQYRERKTWGQIVLSDAEIVDLVNLKFISEYHKVPSDRIIELRGKGVGILDIHETIMKEKGKAKQPNKGSGHAPSKSKGHKK